MSIPFRIDLTGKVAVVTGGGGVLCSAMARALAECGARVAVLNRTEATAEAAAASIRETGGQAMAVPADVLDPDSLTAARDRLENAWGPADILINGAGGNNARGNTSREYLRSEDLGSAVEGLTTFFDLDPEGFGFVFNLNLIGTLQATQVFSRGMAERGRGCVVNISSMAALAPLTKVPAYSGAKSAVNNFTQWLAAHFSKVGIRVNAIAPGFYITEQNRTLMTREDGSWTDRAEAILKHIPQDRFGDPEDLLGTLLWLVDDGASGYVTGTIIPVDGGFSAFSGI